MKRSTTGIQRMEDHQIDFKLYYYILAIIILMFCLSKNSHADNASVFMVKSNSSANSITFEVFADVATKFLGSYDLAISFNQEHLHFQSLRFGDTCCQLGREPKHSVKDGLIKVNGIYTILPKDLVSLLFVHFEVSSNCVNLPFELYVYGLVGKDIDLPVDVIGYEITQNAIERMHQKQQDQLPLVDDATIELLIPIVGMRYDQKDLFSKQLIKTIGEKNTNKYLSDILRLSRVAQHLDVEMNGVHVIDIIKCLQVLSGMDNVTCNNIVGETHAEIDDVMAYFQKMSFLPIDNN